MRVPGLTLLIGVMTLCNNVAGFSILVSNPTPGHCALDIRRKNVKSVGFPPNVDLSSAASSLFAFVIAAARDESETQVGSGC